MDNKKQTRRQMLRKTAMFAVPTIVSFQLSEMQVQASNCTPNNWNNGNHYGNYKPDQNPQDWKNQFDGHDIKPPKDPKPKPEPKKPKK